MKRCRRACRPIALAWVVLCAPLSAAEPRRAADAIEFNRDIRPLLSDHCYQCHGPDQAKRQADLRLDTEAGARTDLGGRAAIVPGKPEESELYLRLIADDRAERMPPEKTGRSLAPGQIDLVRQWIKQGAPWQAHWSLIAPSRPDLPVVQNDAWVRNPIDAFVLARLEREGLRPAPETDKTTLLRRASFDLTGLPPTPEDVDKFLADDSPDAYERVVDRLLSSSRYGERMAARWLDGARYADTNGYQTDAERYMWRWRDWVVAAYNRNVPFDRFTIEQLAGDMLPEATLDQQIASGFNRNHRGNGEGGIIPEEFAVEYVVDRVETTFTVWMGLTMGCSRCHDHKFDPLTQRDFYQSFAYFNNVPERGKANKYGNSPPMIKAPTAAQQRVLRHVDEQLNAERQTLADQARAIAADQRAWEQTVDRRAVSDWSVTFGQEAHFELDGPSPRDARAPLPRWEAGDASHVVGRVDRAAEFDGARFINAGDVGPFGFYDKFTLAAWIRPQGEAGGTILSRMLDEEQGPGYSLVLKQGRLQFNLVFRWLDDALRVESRQTFAPGEWRHVLVTYDGTRLASGVELYVDGAPVELNVQVDVLNQSFDTKAPFRIGGGHGAGGRFHGAIDDVRVYERALNAREAAIVAVPESISQLLFVSPSRRLPAQAEKLLYCFLEREATGSLHDTYARCESLRHERDRLIDTFPSTMVMQELPQPREAYLLVRGEYDKPGEAVRRQVPACLPALPGDLPNDRLGFARWLVSRDHPLTARVTVNRLWQMLFGIGLVKTVDDFGAQGEWPSHPELLDWLAAEFISPAGGDETAWDVKRLLRLLVTSAAYRQSSQVLPELLVRDPENRLLARGPRLRLPAEMVRDSALFAAGLLVERPEGPSVKPYQPEGLWRELGDADYVQDSGSGLYRRSMFTFWKRSVAPPSMMTFDAAGRETCVVRESRTNTPLQALTLMNDVTFVEASRALARRAMRSGDSTAISRLTRMFRLALSRPPVAAEIEVLAAGWHVQLARFTDDPAQAEKLLSQGEMPRDPALNVPELAAYTVVAGIILNLDEAITKE